MFRFSVSNGVRRITVNATSEDKIRDVIENSGLEMGSGTITVDGTAVSLDEMGKAIADLDLNPEITHSVMSVAKLNCAVNVVIAGGVAIVSSEYTPEVLKNAKKYRPDSLKLVNEDKELLYSIAPVNGNKGSVDQRGAEFSSAVNSNGKATAAIQLPNGMTREQFVEDYAGVLSKIRKIEAQIEAACADIETERAGVAELVTEL